MRALAVIVAAFIVMVVGGSALVALTDVATAPSRVISRTMDTDNILSNYEYFHDANANYTARMQQIAEQRPLVSAESDHTERMRLQMELGAMQQSCREIAAGYNSNSEKLNRNLFKSRNLPYTLDSTACAQGAL